MNHYRYVVVDASSRLDSTTRLLSDLSNAVLMVAQTDVVSLWSASRIQAFLEEGAGRNRVRMVLNRYKKIPGFTDEDVEHSTRCKVLWKIPNAFQCDLPRHRSRCAGGSAGGSGSKPLVPRVCSGVGRSFFDRRRWTGSGLWRRKGRYQKEIYRAPCDYARPRRPVGIGSCPVPGPGTNFWLRAREKPLPEIFSTSLHAHGPSPSSPRHLYCR